jgi:alkylhydroperoxidase/carboxymuconolactone decarboxylase family protein
VSYYEADDLKKFKEVGNFKPELMEKFFDYYGEVTSMDGALTKREKSLIALALSHALKCPYCIDAYTTACLESGSNPDQMTEAIHIAAAMQAGITLVHGVQMQNAMKKNGAL